MEQLGAATPQRDELYALPIQLVQFRIGRELGIENQFLRQLARALFPKLDEPEDLIVLLVFPQIAVGVTEESLLAVLGQKGQNPLLAAAALGYIVLLQQRVFAMEGDGVKIQVERRTVLQA